MRLSIVYENDKIFTEFNTQDFRKLLVEQVSEEYRQVVGKAFDEVCEMLKEKVTRM